MRRWGIILSIVFFIICMDGELTSASPDSSTKPALTFEQILSRYKAATTLPPRIEFKAEEDIWVQSGSESPVERELQQIAFYKDIDRLSVLLNVFVLDARSPKTNWKIGTPYFFTEITAQDTKSITYQAHEGKPTYVEFLPDRIKASEDASWLLGDGHILEGFAAYDGSHDEPAAHIADIIATGNAPTVVEKGTGAGILYELHSTGPQGIHAITVDPRNNFLPVRIEITKHAGDLLNSKPIDSDLISSETVVDQIQIKHLEDTFIPVSARIIKTARYQNGKISTVTTLHRRFDINTNPQFSEDEFKINIPDGTPIARTKGDGALNYVWQGGKAVPMMDPQLVAGIKSAALPSVPFPRKHSWVQLLGSIIVCVILLIMIATLVFLIRRRAHNVTTTKNTP